MYVELKSFFPHSLTRYRQPMHAFDTVQTKVMSLKIISASHPDHENPYSEDWGPVPRAVIALLTGHLISSILLAVSID